LATAKFEGTNNLPASRMPSFCGSSKIEDCTTQGSTVEASVTARITTTPARRGNEVLGSAETKLLSR
jgi:hypothetical protein